MVVFKEEVGEDELLSHKQLVRELLTNSTSDHRITFEYSIGKDFRGYAAKMENKLVNLAVWLDSKC